MDEEISRRLFSKVLATFAASQLFKTPIISNDKIMDSSYLHQFKLGSINCTVLYDMDFIYKGHDFFMNVEEGIIVKELSQFDQTLDRIPSPYIGLLLEFESNKILIDTGVGFMEVAQEINGQRFKLEGRLLKLLEDVGVSGDEITHLILTHFHPDHIGGVYSSSGDLLYRNAIIYAHQDEWQYWMGSQSAHQPPIFRYFIDSNIVPLKDESLHLIKSDEEEILESIRLIKTPGHTPGHLSVAIESDGEYLLYISDTWLHPLHITHLDWETSYDLDQDQARKSRMYMLGEAYQKNMLMQSFHFPFPGLGFVDKVKNGWKWVPK